MLLVCRQWHRQAVDAVFLNQFHNPIQGGFDPFRTTWRVFVEIEYYRSPLIVFIDYFTRGHWLLVNQAGHQSYGMFIQFSRSSIRGHELPCILLDDFYINGEWRYIPGISAGQNDRIEFECPHGGRFVNRPG